MQAMEAVQAMEAESKLCKNVFENFVCIGRVFFYSGIEKIHVLACDGNCMHVGSWLEVLGVAMDS